MTITYYDSMINWVPAQGQPIEGESYTRLPDGTGYKVTLGAVFYYSDSTYLLADISGDLDPGWYTLSVTWYHDPWGAPSRTILSNSTIRSRSEYHFYVTDSDSNPLEGVSGLGTDLGGGHYRSRELKSLTKTFTPIKIGYEFDSISFTDESRSAYITVPEVSPRQVILLSPTNTETGITLQPLLQWSISEGGAEAGDLLDIYLRKDDANFTTNDQLGFDVDATLNSSLQIVAGLEYGATYYWQVQAADSEENDLLSSTVYSFTVQSFSPPSYSTHPISELPTGENNQITVRRLIVAAKDKIYYEDLS